MECETERLLVHTMHKGVPWIPVGFVRCDYYNKQSFCLFMALLLYTIILIWSYKEIKVS
jgi:hypothetical protein